MQFYRNFKDALRFWYIILYFFIFSRDYVEASFSRRKLQERYSNTPGAVFVSASFIDKLYLSKNEDYSVLMMRKVNENPLSSVISLPSVSYESLPLKFTLFRLMPREKSGIMELFRNAYGYIKHRISRKNTGNVLFRLKSNNMATYDKRIRIKNSGLYSLKTMEKYSILKQLRRSHQPVALGWTMSTEEALLRFKIPSSAEGTWIAYTIVVPDFDGNDISVHLDNGALIGQVLVTKAKELERYDADYFDYFSLLYRKGQKNLYLPAVPSSKERYVNVTLDPFLEQPKQGNSLFWGNNCVYRDNTYNFKIHQFRHFRRALFPGSHALEFSIRHPFEGYILQEFLGERNTTDRQLTVSGSNKYLDYELILTRNSYTQSRARFPFDFDKISGRMLSVDVFVRFGKYMHDGEYQFEISSVYKSRNSRFMYESTLYTDRFKITSRCALFKNRPRSHEVEPRDYEADGLKSHPISFSSDDSSYSSSPPLNSYSSLRLPSGYF